MVPGGGQFLIIEVPLQDARARGDETIWLNHLLSEARNLSPEEGEDASRHSSASDAVAPEPSNRRPKTRSVTPKLQTLNQAILMW